MVLPRGALGGGHQALGRGRRLRVRGDRCGEQSRDHQVKFHSVSPRIPNNPAQCYTRLGRRPTAVIRREPAAIHRKPRPHRHLLP